jgi:epoxyqueuosine reductase QueG
MNNKVCQHYIFIKMDDIFYKVRGLKSKINRGVFKMETGNNKESVLNCEIFDLAEKNGISYCGIANLSTVPKTAVDQGNTGIYEYPRSISLGIALNKEIVDKLPLREQYPYVLNYRHHAYDIINQRLDITASIISSLFQGKGCRALPIPASERINNENIYAAFSHKLGARLSGLGWIGKSCMLITPKDGPRVRWTSILTDAPLDSSEEMIKSRCNNCRECVDICPVNAFTGRGFNENEPREARYNAHKCERYFVDMKSKGKLDVCGMCMYICPYGRQ